MQQTNPLIAREAAYHTLIRIFRDRQMLDQALNHEAPSAAADRAFSRRLVLLCLRRWGQVQALLDHYVTPETPMATRVVCALGLVQLIESEVPDHAALDTTVALAQKVEIPGKLVNAILRRVQRESADYRTLPVTHNLPNIWQERWQHYDIQALAQTFVAEPPIDICVKRDPAIWAERLGAEILYGNTLRLPKCELTQLPGYESGDWWVQDVAASLPVMALGDVKGKRVIDIGAAPGGKSMQLAAAGAQVTAVDASAKRLKRMQANLERTQLDITCLQADARAWTPAELPDAVLIDAPCSATGTLRRHPELLHLKTAEDVSEMVHLQRAILKQIGHWLPRGVPVVYATCSIEPEEGEAQMAWWCETVEGLRIQPMRAEDYGWPEEWVSANGTVRTLPSMLADRGGMDGFYIARLMKQ